MSHSFIFFQFQLASKTAELSKACEKQFKLEQELAFYKLDAKFEHLGMLPLPDGVEVIVQCSQLYLYNVASCTCTM